MTALEVKEMLSKVDLHSLSNEELRSLGDLLSTTGTQIKCILIRRKHSEIHHPLPNNKETK